MSREAEIKMWNTSVTFVFLSKRYSCGFVKLLLTD